jgi:hypothetical protein
MTEIISSNYAKKNKKLDKEATNIIRTIQRNNVQLIHLSDNKAAILLSLNAIMLTLLIPNVISNMDLILENLLYVPLLILAGTSFCTVCISSFVLIPPKFLNTKNVNGNHHTKNPFFYGNIYKMKAAFFFEKFEQTLASKKDLQEYLAMDIYYSGNRLGYKMKWVRLAFQTFILGLSFAVAYFIISLVI